MSTQEHEAAAEKADWWQVISNGGPPCFYLQTDPKFVTGPQYCLRAERWEGHRNACMHPYVTLGMLVSGFVAALADAVRVARAEQEERTLHGALAMIDRVVREHRNSSHMMDVPIRQAINQWWQASRKVLGSRAGEGDATAKPHVCTYQCADTDCEHVVGPGDATPGPEPDKYANEGRCPACGEYVEDVTTCGCPERLANKAAVDEQVRLLATPPKKGGGR